MKNQLSRRSFMKGLLAGSGLTIFLAFTPDGFRVLGAKEIKKADLKDLTLNAWIEISPDDLVTIIVSQSEMGQGVYTSIPMIVADELEADWKTVRFRAAPAADEYKNPIWGMQSTGGSTSIRHFHDLLRQAGAAAREMLLEAAAQALEGSPEGVHGRQRRRSAHRDRPVIILWEIGNGGLPFAPAQGPPAERPVPIPVYRAAPAAVGYPGKGQRKGPFRHRHLHTGYALRLRRPAASFWGQEKSYDPNAAGKIKGVEQVVRIGRGVAVCARSFEAARRGRVSPGSAMGPRLPAGSG